MITFIDFPMRFSKPRNLGMNILIDNGLSTSLFQDIVTSHFSHIDMIKFGWCTSLITKDLDLKIDILQQMGIDYFFGGTLFEKACVQNKIVEYKRFLKAKKSRFVEISNGTIPISINKKAVFIEDFAKDFIVLSEVGTKDSEESMHMAPHTWIEEIASDFNAGATYVITEARESGKSGIANSEGGIRFGLIDEIINSNLYDVSKLIFEAPNPKLQKFFIKKMGSNVNLANIAFTDIIGCETLRLGLRSGTLTNFEHTLKNEFSNSKILHHA